MRLPCLFISLSLVNLSARLQMKKCFRSQAVLAALAILLFAGANSTAADKQAQAASHWAFQLLKTPDSKSKNALDQLVSQQLKPAGLAISKEADRETLV